METAWSRSKLAFKWNSGQPFLEAQLQKKDLSPSTHWHILSFTQSISQSLSKHLSIYNVLGPMLGFRDTDESWTYQDIEATGLDHFKLH